MDAIKNPSSEYLQIYIGLGLVLAAIAGIVFMAFGGKQETLKVTIDDIPADERRAKPSKSEPKEKEKKSSKSSSKKTASSKASPAAAAGDSNKLNTTDLFKDLDQQAANFNKVYGVLDKQSIVLLKKIIGKHSYIAFRERKEVLMHLRLAAFKENRQEDYQKLIMQASTEF